MLESQLTSRRQRELELERQVAELQSRAEQLGGAVSSAEAAASRMTQLEQQVGVPIWMTAVCIALWCPGRLLTGCGGLLLRVHPYATGHGQRCERAQRISATEACANALQVVRLEASLRVASVERQQLEQRLKQAGDDAAALQQEMQRELDGLRVQLAAKEAAHRWVAVQMTTYAVGFAGSRSV